MTEGNICEKKIKNCLGKESEHAVFYRIYGSCNDIYPIKKLKKSVLYPVLIRSPVDMHHSFCEYDIYFRSQHDNIFILCRNNILGVSYEGVHKSVGHKNDT